jgi:hypothetical protein
MDFPLMNLRVWIARKPWVERNFRKYSLAS